MSKIPVLVAGLPPGKLDRRSKIRKRADPKVILPVTGHPAGDTHPSTKAGIFDPATIRAQLAEMRAQVAQSREQLWFTVGSGY
jgi:hypothetical protein